MEKKDILKKIRKLNQDDRVELLRNILSLNRKKHRKYRCSCTKGTLICLKHGIIKGSEICPHCHGWHGRDPYIEGEHI